MTDEAVAAPRHDADLEVTGRSARAGAPARAPQRADGTAAGHRRFHAALRRPANWYELVRFGAVGASGYVVNLAVFTFLFHGANVAYQLAAVGAFVVALTNNFVWNRHWTFKARDGHAGFQAARFVVVSVLAFGFNLVVLTALVEWLHVAEVPAQAIAIAAATPLNFLGNKLWSFRT